MWSLLRNNKQLITIMLCAFVVKLIQVLLVCTISGDGPAYIRMAKNFFAGNFSAGLAEDYPPLYSLFIAAAYSITNDWVIAGRLVSFIFSILTIVPIYFLTKELFGEKVAKVASVFFIFHPAIGGYSVRIISEPIYVFLFVSAVWLSWKAISTQKHSLLFAAGAISGLSYLVRPEGLGVAIVTCLYVSFHDLLRVKYNYRKKIIHICMLLLGASIFVLPYLLHIRNETGQWKLSKKKSILNAVTGKAYGNSVPDASVLFGARIPAYSRMEDGFPKIFLGFVGEFITSFHYLLFLLLLIGLIRRKAIPRQGKYESFIILITIFYFLLLSLFYVSDRHIVPLIAMCLFWAAIGFCELYRYVSIRMPQGLVETMPILRGRVFALMLMAVILSSSAEAFRPQDRDKIGRRKVGLWMKENCKESPRILTDSLRLAYYAEGEAVRVQNRPNISKYDDLMKFVKSSPKGIDYVVIDKVTIGRYCPDFLDAVSSSDLVAIHVQPKLEHSAYGELIVYEVKQ